MSKTKRFYFDCNEGRMKEKHLSERIKEIFPGMHNYILTTKSVSFCLDRKVMVEDLVKLEKIGLSNISVSADSEEGDDCVYIEAQKVKPEELKPCPFCGSDELQVSIGYRPYVYCGDCDAMGPLCKGDELAVEAWNKAARPSKGEK